jgi:DNA repair exonuclease SbcCD ATPase subunit
MRIKILSLTLQCRQSREIINFSSHITYIHGQISAGKSSILRLIDYCLGGSLEKTIAITRELVNVELRTQIGEYEVLFEREVEGSNWVQVTWRRDNGDFSSVLAPIKVSRESKAIWNTDIYNLSDLIFHLAGITPIKVRKSKQAEDSDLVRLSIRDMLWYCYLEQDNLDSSFYNLADPFRKLKSRDVMRFVTGFYTERMNELEIELDQVTDERYAKQEAAKQIRQFLQDFGYAGESEIQAEIEKAQKQLTELNGQQYSIRQEYSSSTHLADELREQLRALSERLDQENSVLKDLVERINEQEALKAELVTAKFKLARSESASAVLSGIRFESCPSCGTDLQTLNRTSPDMCNLCGSQLTQSSDDLSLRASVISQDLSSRIEDLDESISHHSRARTIQQKRIEQLRYEKGLLDSKLTQVLADYDSAYLARSREVERQTATLEERIRNLGQTLRMFDAVQDLEKTSELRK